MVWLSFSYKARAVDVRQVGRELGVRYVLEVVGAIEPKLREAELGRSRLKPTSNLTAYDLYLRAVFLFDHQGDAVEALELLNDAIRTDPNFGLAYALAAHFRA